MEQIVDLANMYSESELEAAMERGIIFRAFGYGQLKRTLGKQRRNPLSLPWSAQESIGYAYPVCLHARYAGLSNGI